MRPGKTSLITVHATGPIENAKQMMKPTRANRVTIACRARARGRGGADSGAIGDELEGDPAHHDQADPHPDQPGEQQLPPPQTVILKAPFSQRR